jgi:hypothetical protein
MSIIDNIQINQNFGEKATKSIDEVRKREEEVSLWRSLNEEVRHFLKEYEGEIVHVGGCPNSKNDGEYKVVNGKLEKV